MTTKINIPEYALRNVKEVIANWRREERWILGIIVHLPVEMETSLDFFQGHYRQAATFFQLSTDLRYGEMAIEKVDPKP